MQKLVVGRGILGQRQQKRSPRISEERGYFVELERLEQVGNPDGRSKNGYGGKRVQIVLVVKAPSPPGSPVKHIHYHLCVSLPPGF